MDGGLLIRVKEMGEKVRIAGRGSGTVLFFLIVWVNAAGSPLQAGPDPATCFVGSAVTLLTRSVLTRTSLSSASQS